ncbi:uncharacterized protein axed isoform X2 [Atheta coriaria]|uniref:uncharacterized protein axed isoform X2 n=1 Tax=Dalotia coriaria TaxID=877792 RepID=UPI0031F46B64
MVIVSNNPEVEPMLEARHPTIKRNPLTEEAYRNITGSMRAEPLQIDSPKTALELLFTATQLQNMPLVNECIKNLDEHLDKDTVLMILSHLSKCKLPSNNKNEFEPSAPPIIENENQRGTDWVSDLVNNLRHNCLLVIDKDADYILKKKEIVDLSYADLMSILERDTLEVSDEMFVYIAVYNWGIAECNRMKLNTQHHQGVLRQLRFTPRYGLMCRREFTSRNVGLIKGPTKSGILDENEWRQIRFYIEQRARNRCVNELDYKMSRRRIIGVEKPKILSCKSLQRFEQAVSRRDSEAGKQKSDRCIINLLACWTAFFD